MENETTQFRCDTKIFAKKVTLHTNRRGLSLVELLVAIGIVLILLAIFLPAIQSVREASRSVSCLNNLRETGLAISSWSTSNSERLPKSWRTIQDASGNSLSNPDLSLSPYSFSWRTTLLPQLEFQDLNSELDYDLAPFSSANQQVISKVIPVFQCPSTPNSPRSYEALDGVGGPALGTLLGATDYEHVQFVGTRETPLGQIDHTTALPGAWYGLNDWEEPRASRPARAFELRGSRDSAKLAWIRDGLSNTILVIEKAGQRANHPGVEPITFDLGGAWALAELGGIAKHSINENNFSGMYSFHPSGSNVLMCDGSTRFLNENSSLELIVGLSSRSGGEVPPSNGEP